MGYVLKVKFFIFFSSLGTKGDVHQLLLLDPRFGFISSITLSWWSALSWGKSWNQQSRGSSVVLYRLWSVLISRPLQFWLDVSNRLLLAACVSTALTHHQRSFFWQQMETKQRSTTDQNAEIVDSRVPIHSWCIRNATPAPKVQGTSQKEGGIIRASVAGFLVDH